MEKPRKVIIERELCKECGYCIYFCPTHVLEADKSLNSKGYHPAILVDEDGCIMCGICAQVCPEAAIEVYRIKEEVRR